MQWISIELCSKLALRTSEQGDITVRDKEYMPTVLRVGAYRLFFYAGDRDEPQHIHVEREDKIAKFWLDPIRLQRSGGFSRAELSRIHKIIWDHHIQLVEAWNEYFGN